MPAKEVEQKLNPDFSHGLEEEKSEIGKVILPKREMQQATVLLGYCPYFDILGHLSSVSIYSAPKERPEKMEERKIIIKKK